MPGHQRLEGSKGHRLVEKPNSNSPSTSYSVSNGIPSATTENITNRLTSLGVANKSEQFDVSEPSIQFGNTGLTSNVPLPGKKSKAYETVSAATTTKVNKAPADSTTVLANETRTTSNEKLHTVLNSLLENFTVDDSTYSVAQISAAFYPKFENENSDQEIRTRMIEMVSKGLATLEVSLKHSGSLFMYAGHKGGAYSKNSYGNIYTAVGVFVLGHMFREAWGSQASMKQAEFNEFLECNRMCISMELVTAVLGDHGQRPREDYVVVTAVTELGSGRPKFYQTPDIIAFCRKWRLPTNHIWLFFTRKSVSSFFAAYDTLCEEGTATPVCKTLDDIADISVPGSKDHVKVQGEILEGLVARIVSHESSKHMEQVLRDYPPPPSNEGDQHLSSSLREICAANINDEKQLIKALIDGVGPSFCPNSLDWFCHEVSHSLSKDIGESVLNLFLSSHPADFSTEKLEEMFDLMKKLCFSITFKCCHNFHKINSVSSNNLHFKMVIHVHCDSAFRLYQKEMRRKTGLWPLYRGFFVDLNLFKVNKERLAEFSKENNAMVETGGDTNGASTKYGLAKEDANLMIKLKFLAYKTRTFLIRNGLSILFRKGPAAYKNYYSRQMTKWNTSVAKQEELSKMLDEWAVSMHGKFGDKQLPSSTYLSEAEPFLEQYAQRSPLNQTLIGSAGNLARTEDFLAIVEGSKDVEGDLEPKREITPSSPVYPDNEEAVRMDEGLIIFFPGIPGCAKSALCKEILSTPGGLGDDRPVHSLMSDRIKGSRYWVRVSELLCKEPYSILLADKNAPTEEVWRQIEDMCRSTKASAVPVIPDLEGTKSNPFCLDALAVFMLRVLNRVNHPGKLDKKSPNAGYALLKFYHLYDGKSRQELESELIERFGSLVKMPLLEPERSSLPESVRSILEEGISLYKLHTNRHGRLETKRTYANEWLKWEKQLQETLHGNAVYLNYIQVPFEFAVAKVLEQLKAIAKGQYAAPSTEKRRFGTIFFAAVSLPVSGILDLIENLSGKDPKIEEILENMNLKSSLTKAHVTLAHKRSHGVTAVASYGPYLHQNVPVDITALFFSDQSAALEAELGTVDGEKLSSKNEWPHLTVWTAEGVTAKKANLLPHLFKLGKATRIDIKPPITITGTLEFF